MLDTKQQYKIRKFITELKKYRGRHTELVSVYIPAGYDIIKIIQHLAQEQGTASNIKDKTTRLNVQTALERMIRHLRLYSKTPENGMAAFSGNIASQEGKQDIKVWSIEPPVPVNIRLYRCDQTFVLGPLEDMMTINEVYGLIVLDNREATIGFLKGKTIGGPGPTKETFANTDHLHNELKKKIVAIKDITYTDEQGLHELVEKARDTLAEAEITKEKQILKEFFTLLATNSKKAAY